MWKRLFSLLLIDEWITWGNTSLDPLERQQGWALAKRTATRVLIAIGGAVGIGALGMYAVLVLGSNTVADPPGIETSDSINVIAKEPGVAFDVTLFCNAPDVVVGKTVMTDAPRGGVRYIAQRGTESVNWADSPEGQNPNAVYYVTQPNGTQTGVPVEMTKQAAKCFKEKAR